MMAGRDTGRIPPMITAIVLTVACASAGLGRSSVPQPPTRASHTGLVSGSWERVEVIGPDAALVVTLKSGNRVQGTFKTLHPMTLSLVERDGNDFSIPKSDVAKIIARRASDGLTNGALTGAEVGLAAAVVFCRSPAQETDICFLRRNGERRCFSWALAG